jgi:hypothetical protein
MRAVLFGVIVLGAATGNALGVALSAHAIPPRVDIVIYGQTICGITGAVAAARMNATVALVSERGDNHLGGMTTGGLSAMDLNMATGGVWAEFMARTGIPQKPFPSFRARDASATVAAMLAEVADRVTVILNTSGVASVERDGGSRRLLSLTTVSGLSLTASYFIDCSYEGDLLRASGTAFAVGREAASVYNESLAGAEGPPWAAGHFPRYANGTAISPFVDSTNTTLLPSVSYAPDEAPGQADGRVQSYNHRLCVTNVPEFSVPFLPPPDYTPAALELSRREWTAKGPASANLTIGDLFLIRAIPGGQGKIDVNDGGGFRGSLMFGTDMPFLQDGYPLANWAQRVAISAQHEWWIRSLWHFLATDASGAVPERVQRLVASYGLCSDEFNATGHYPPQLYVREAIRLVGARVLTQADVFGAKVRHDARSIGLSRWLVDIHAVQRIAVRDGQTGEWSVANAGGRNTVSAPWQLTEVAYDAIIPSAADPGGASNLLVPACASFSHVGYASFRLEPQFAIFGHSAAVAAVLSLRNASADVQDLNVPALQKQLLAQGQILNATAPPPSAAITLQACNTGGKGDYRQLWAFSEADATLRLASGTYDPTAVHFSESARREGAGGRQAAGWAGLSPAARTLLRGPTAEGALSTVCASVFGYAKAPGTPLWAATCHTDDPDPAHQNQEYILEQTSGGALVRSRLSGLCVGVDFNAEPPALVLSDACGGNGTVWTVAEAAGGAWVLRGGQGTGLCATAPGWSGT